MRRFVFLSLSYLNILYPISSKTTKFVSQLLSVCLSVSLSAFAAFSLSLVYCVLFNSYLESFVVKKEV